MPAMDYSKIADLYDLYAQTEVDIPCFIQELEFYLHSKETFESLAFAQGFRVEAFYGDYERGAFQPQTSPFMIWILSK